jgi:hypothetical protein
MLCESNKFIRYMQGMPEEFNNSFFYRIPL